MFQIVALFSLVAVAFAAPGHLGYAAAPAVVAAAPAVYAAPAVVASGPNSREIARSEDGFGNFASSYAVSDALTGDHKVSHESGLGGAAVAGSFSQLDPNGYERRTDYVADAFGSRQVVTGSENGLYVNAKDHAIRPHGAAVVAAAAPAVSYAAPAVAAVAPAVSYAAPAIAHTAYAAAPAIAHGYGFSAAPGLGYGYGHGLGYAAHGLGYAAHGIAHGYGYAAPALGYGHHVKHIL